MRTKATASATPYLKGFLKNIMLRPSCADCPFCEYPRQGDITLGDFWGVSRLMPGAEDNKGVSIVMINNKTGEKAFNKIKDSLIYCVRYDGPKLQMPNRVKAVYPASPLRERFFDLIKRKILSLRWRPPFRTGSMSGW